MCDGLAMLHRRSRSTRPTVTSTYLRSTHDGATEPRAVRQPFKLQLLSHLFPILRHLSLARRLASGRLADDDRVEAAAQKGLGEGFGPPDAGFDRLPTGLMQLIDLRAQDLLTR